MTLKKRLYFEFATEPFNEQPAQIIRYTSDANGQGVHEGQPGSNEPLSWGAAGRDQHISQHSGPEGSINRWTEVTRWWR